MPDQDQTWELRIVRTGEQARHERRRTIGQYQVWRAGVPQPELSGTSVETKGPGDNKVAGNGRRVEAGRYALSTHSGPHYATLGYMLRDDSDQTPKPGLELRHTGARFDILVHPGHGFLASVGCINLTRPLSSGAVDIPFVDSRDRVVAIIDDLKAFFGPAFPHYNNQPIPNAFVVIEGEPH